VKRLLVMGLPAAAALVAGGWAALVRAQGDSLMAVEPPELTGISQPPSTTGPGLSVHGEATIRNQGKAGGVVHRVEGRLVGGGPGRVLVTRKDSATPERGWWRSLCLTPGEACVAEVDIELDGPPEGPLVVELDVHEIGRRLKVHRVARLAVPLPATAAATAGP
jgi:hypothetical protein